ncbi:MAG: hypothetical protein CMH57_10960 [Myxococcales bacterium]|nr:hypothetical protein [Myxococcales bacterium]
MLHPLALAMLVLWATNDHLLKALYPGWWTGKLSDVASLAFAPLLLTAAWEVGAHALGSDRWRRSRVALWAAMALLGAVMVGINLWDGWAWAYRHGLGLAQWPFFLLRAGLTGAPWPEPATVDLTMDPTDLLTLPALLIPAWVHRRARGPRGA